MKKLQKKQYNMSSDRILKKEILKYQPKRQVSLRGLTKQWKDLDL
jgi:hypothetical protein